MVSVTPAALTFPGRFFFLVTILGFIGLGAQGNFIFSNRLDAV